MGIISAPCLAWSPHIPPLKDYDGAIKNYEEALSLEPSYEPALYDVGATYTNSASADQQNKKKADSVKIKLEKSTNYFERLHSVNKKNFDAIAQLVENYDLLGKKDKANSFLTELEALKTTDVASDPAFWDLLGKLYARLGRSDESADAYKKSDKLRH